jgi:hypothetical protein
MPKWQGQRPSRLCHCQACQDVRDELTLVTGYRPLRERLGKLLVARGRRVPVVVHRVQASLARRAARTALALPVLAPAEGQPQWRLSHLPVQDYITVLKVVDGLSVQLQEQSEIISSLFIGLLRDTLAKLEELRKSNDHVPFDKRLSADGLEFIDVVIKAIETVSAWVLGNGAVTGMIDLKRLYESFFTCTGSASDPTWPGRLTSIAFAWGWIRGPQTSLKPPRITDAHSTRLSLTPRRRSLAA